MDLKRQTRKISLKHAGSMLALSARSLENPALYRLPNGPYEDTKKEEEIAFAQADLENQPVHKSEAFQQALRSPQSQRGLGRRFVMNCR
jgi:hypothetical protein